MKILYFIKACLVVILFFLSDSLFAQDNYKVNSYNKEYEVFFKNVYTNPATYKYHSYNSYKGLSVSWQDNRRSDNNLVQLGTRDHSYKINAVSFINKEGRIFYGDLSYEKGRRYDVGWTKTSDYNLLYPYIIASKEDLNSHFENYHFSGGYAFEKGNYNIGIWGNYTAKYEYSEKDPRPKNVISKYSLKIGVSRSLGEKYVLGLHVTGGSYKQKNSVQLFKPGTDARFFFMKGFGFYNDSFSKIGTSISCDYLGEEYVAGLQLLPQKTKGLYSSVEIKSFSFDQDFNTISNYTTLFSLDSKIYDFNLGYCGGKREFRYFVNTYVDYSTRNGVENDYNNVSHLQYEFITSHEKYSEENFKVGVNTLLNVNSNKSFSYWFKLKSEYLSKEISYASPSCFDNVSTLNTNLSVGIYKRFKKSCIKCEVGSRYSKNVDSEIRLLGNKTVEGIVKDMIIHNHDYLTSDVLTPGLSLKYDYLTKSNKTIYIEGLYELEKIENFDDSKFLKVSLGLTF